MFLNIFEFLAQCAAYLISSQMLLNVVFGDNKRLVILNSIVQILVNNSVDIFFAIWAEHRRVPFCSACNHDTGSSRLLPKRFDTFIHIVGKVGQYFMSSLFSEENHSVCYEVLTSLHISPDHVRWIVFYPFFWNSFLSYISDSFLSFFRQFSILFFGQFSMLFLTFFYKISEKRIKFIPQGYFQANRKMYYYTVLLFIQRQITL